MKRILLSWSSGKDSAWSLHVLRKNREHEILGLLTTFNEAANRVAMHAVRRELVERQAAATGLPLWPVHLPWPCSNEQYEGLMAEACKTAISNGIEGIAFGDLFLEDVRAYREKQLKGTALEPIFPLWGQPTHELARGMIASGLRAKLTCVDTNQLDAEFVGREFDEDLLAAPIRNGRSCSLIIHFPPPPFNLAPRKARRLSCFVVELGQPGSCSNVVQGVERGWTVQSDVGDPIALLEIDRVHSSPPVSRAPAGR
jgi:diphthamide synthase (EF-2-diphthine--ammonia ligase)